MGPKGHRSLLRPGFPVFLLGPFLLLTGAAAPCLAADFTRSFANITQGDGILLIWEEIDAKYMPLTVYAQVLNRTGVDRANVFKRNLTVGINGTSWLWQNMPSPLPYLATGLYQVEIKAETWIAPVIAANASRNATAQQPVFPRSPYFSILDGTTIKPLSGSGDSSSSGGGGTSGPNGRTTSMVVGLVVGFVIIAIACTMIFFWRKRFVRKRKEMRRRKRFDVVID